MQGCHCSCVMHVKSGQADASSIKQEREASCFKGFGNVQDGMSTTIRNMTESQESWRNTHESNCNCTKYGSPDVLQFEEVAKTDPRQR